MGRHYVKGTVFIKLPNPERKVSSLSLYYRQRHRHSEKLNNWDSLCTGPEEVRTVCPAL